MIIVTKDIQKNSKTIPPNKTNIPPTPAKNITGGGPVIGNVAIPPELFVFDQGPVAQPFVGRIVLGRKEVFYRKYLLKNAIEEDNAETESGIKL